MIASVIVPVFNAAGSVARAIDSALAQTFTGEFEVIVINDGATDASAQILARYGKRIRVLKQNNRGAGAARNTGAANSDAEFLAFLDADDVWAPAMLETTVTALRHNPDAVLAYCNAVCVDSIGRVVAPTIVTPDRDHPPSMAELLTHWWPILPSAVTIRRCGFEQCGGFGEDLRAYEDVYLWLRARECGPFEYIARPLMYYCARALPQRMAIYEPYHRQFIRHVRKRYGHSASGIVRDTHRAYVSAFGWQGLAAIRRGDMREARQSFVRALRHSPLDLRTALRLARTFLPQTVAQWFSASSGRS